MKLKIRVFACIAVFILFTGAYALRGLVAPLPHTQEYEDAGAETALRVITENCGKCHSPGLPTTDAKALAVFDLSEKPWYGRVTDEHLLKVAKRIHGSSQISAEDKAAVENFLQSVRKVK